MSAPGPAYFALGLKPWLGDAAIWWSFPFGSITSAMLAYGYYRWGRWRERPLMMAQVQTQPLPAAAAEAAAEAPAEAAAPASDESKS